MKLLPKSIVAAGAAFVLTGGISAPAAHAQFFSNGQMIDTSNYNTSVSADNPNPNATPGSAGATPGSAGYTPGSAGATPGSAGATPGSAGATPGSSSSCSGGGGGGSVLTNPLCASSLADLIKALMVYVVQIGTVFVTLMLIYTGFLFVAARGNEEKVSSARTALLWTVVGGLILLGASVIAQAIASTAASL